jgi:hypothetical protein
MTTRREFIKLGIAGVLAAGVPPAYARAASLMPIVVRQTPTGMCYVTVESLSLAQFGNRVPNFEFEVEGVSGGPFVPVSGRARVVPLLSKFGGIKEMSRDLVIRAGGKDGKFDELVMAREFSYSTDLSFVSPGDRLRRAWADGVELPLEMFKTRPAP